MWIEELIALRCPDDLVNLIGPALDTSCYAINHSLYPRSQGLRSWVSCILAVAISKKAPVLVLFA